MPSARLYKLLENLSTQECESFDAYVRSPFFNRNEEVVQFSRLILTHWQENKQLDKEETYQLMYGKESAPDRRVTDLVYYFTQLLESFLAYSGRYGKELLLQKIDLLAEAQDRKLHKLAGRVTEDIKKGQESSPYRDNTYFYREYLFMNELDKSSEAKGKLLKDEILQIKADSLDLFYISAKLRDSCEMLNRSYVLQSEYHFRGLERLLEEINSNLDYYSQHPAIFIYYTLLYMLRTPEEQEHFHKLVKLVDSYGNLFPEEELRGLYNYAQNYCIRKINAGENSFYRELFMLNGKMIAEGIIYSGKYITHTDYKNIVSVALRLQEYEWTLDFIQKYRNSLAEDYRTNGYTYNLANYYYETGDHRKAIKLLRSVEFTDVYYSLDSKTMLLKIYYEIEEEEPFLSLIAAFKLYLNRNKLVTEQNRLIYKNLIKFAKKLFDMRGKLPYQRARNFHNKLAELRKELEQSRNIANSKWLLARLREIEA